MYYYILLIKVIKILFLYLGCIPDDARIAGKLDKDGFPPIGSKLEFGDPCYW